METDFIAIDYDHFDFEGRNYIKIFGRNSKGQRVCAIDTCQVYLWAVLKEGVSEDKIKKLIGKIEMIELDAKGRKTKVEKVELHEKSFLDRKVRALKIFATNYKDLHDVADRLDFPEIECRRGYDLGFDTHYIIEKKIEPMHWYNFSGEVLNNSLEFGGVDSGLDVDFCIRLDSAKKLEESTLNFRPKVLAYDIETDDIKIGEGEILMVSLVTDDFKKVITCRKPIQKKLDFVEYAKDEADLIERFLKYVKELSPDFLVGYFSDGFDLPYLKMRAEKNDIRLSIGLDSSQPHFSRGLEITAKTKGIVHVDLLKFIRTAYSQYMQSETLSLNEVAHEFLGDEKKPFKHQHSSRLGDSGWESYFEYNLHDSVLVYGLFDKMWPDILEFSRVMHEPVAEVTRNGMSKNVESFILHNLERFNEIPEKRPTNEEIGERRSKEKYEGAFVFEPTPGLYENISVFDFTSSYGSTIVTYNLSKSTFLEKETKDSYSIEIQGRKVSFTRKPGFFPEMLKGIIELRKKYKEELKKKPDVIKRARSNAFKLLANASYGYQGFFGARYYSREAAAATAAFAKRSIKDAIEKINKQGYKVIYSDTDSIAFLMEGKAEPETKKFLEKLNSEMPGIMELELEGFFTRGLWVTKRSGLLGAKKKYALLGNDGKLKIRGFETVRRDWCSLARKTQNEVLRMVLQDGNEKRAMDFIKKVIKDLKQRKVQRDEIIIKTMLQKPLAEYKAISPHVIAARKMEEKEIPISGGNLIEYFIAETREKKKLVRDKVKLPDEKGEYNIEYYLNKQILPAVENILQVFNININELIDGKKQTKLGDF